MSSFVFNDFKDRFLNGEVPSADSWYFIPVSEDFKDKFEFSGIRLDHYRSLSDFKDVSDKRYNKELFDYSGTEIGTNHKGKERLVDVSAADFEVKGDALMNGRCIEHKWSKVIDDESFTNKPMFITTANFDRFTTFYNSAIINNTHIQEYLNSEMSGFYFIRSKDELEWFANRSLSNDRIIGVIGDNFEGVIGKPIGSEKVPFNGVLDGNFFNFDITIKAEDTNNGIVAVLGQEGKVRNFKLVHTDSTTNSIECNMPINLNYIKRDGRDVNCGLLVGKNYGLIENIDASNLQTFNLSGFVPSVYSVTNKSDEYKWNESVKIVRKKFDANNENYYFSNSFCINSPGNICPYVGYFAEGKFADDAKFACLDINYNPHSGHYGAFTAAQPDYYEKPGDNLNRFVDSANRLFNYKPLGLFTRDLSGHYENHTFVPEASGDLVFISNGSPSSVDYYVKSPLYYGLDSFGNYTTRLIGPMTVSNFSAQLMDETVICYNNNLVKRDFSNQIQKSTWYSAFAPSYEMTRCSMRMHPQARAAYNVGIIAGANYGTAKNITISAVVKNTSNFVGFIGGFAGLQANGLIQDVSISVDNQLIYDFSGVYSAGDSVIYKTTPIVPDCVKQIITNTSAIEDETKLSLLSAYCSAWYDEGSLNDDDNPVNTAENVTNDCITYKLRPIFIVGGAFGRYVPVFGYGTDRNQKMCSVNNLEVVYKDNYSDTNNIIKRMENAFGAFIGKVDYDNITDSTYFATNMYCSACYFSALSNVGEQFEVIPYKFEDNQIIPVAEQISGTETSSITPLSINKKLIGIYELKYNVLPSVTFNAYNSAVSVTGSMYYGNQLGIYNRGDYPIDMLNHNCGIEQSHILSNYVDKTMSGMTYTDDSGKSYTGYDHWHNYFVYPTISAGVTAANNGNQGIAGWNKRNMARELISMENCSSNMNNNYIQLYDDYVNTWNMNKIPYSLTGKQAFNSQDIYLITKWWNYYRTNDNNCKETTTADIGGWDETEGGPWSAISGEFAWGLDYNRINIHIQQGTQNTFDGYTTVDIKNKQAWYRTYDNNDDVFNSFNVTETELNENQVNCLKYQMDLTALSSTMYYDTYRTYKKNIMPEISHKLTTTAIDTAEFHNKFNWIPSDRDDTDVYYYYNCDDIEHAENNTHNFNTLEDVFAFKYDVQYQPVSNDFGYVTEKEQYNEGITIGQYLVPSAIRHEISESKTLDPVTNQPYYITSSVSASNNFGGVLVVDSSGHNVMFIDNDKGVQLTGNAVTFPVKKTSNGDKCILQVN